MKQITEDYVSYEIAVLLKEKKFSWKCNTAYLEFEDGRIELRYEDKAFYQEQTKRRYCVPALLAPSLYNAMKWLRELHKRHICIRMRDFPSLFEIEVYDTKYGYIVYTDFEHSFHSYEEAVEAALKYTLENLI